MSCNGWRASAWRLEKLWMNLLKEHHPSAHPVLLTPWFAAGDCTRPLTTAKRVRPVIETFGEKETTAALAQMLTRWEDIRARFSGAPAVPDVGYFYAIVPFLVRHKFDETDVERLIRELKECEQTCATNQARKSLRDQLRLVTAAVGYGYRQKVRNAPSRTVSRGAREEESSVFSSGCD